MVTKQITLVRLAQESVSGPLRRLESGTRSGEAPLRCTLLPRGWRVLAALFPQSRVATPLDRAQFD